MRKNIVVVIFLLSLLTNFGVYNPTYAIEIHSEQGFSVDLSDYPLTGDEQIVINVLYQSDVVWQLVPDTSRRVRAENFDPFSGEILSSSIVELPSRLSHYFFTVPTDYSFDQIEISAVDSEGIQRQLEIIDSSDATSYSLVPQAQNLATQSLQSILDASTMTTILDNGPSANRIDILLLGDGYTNADMNQWEIDAEASVASFLTEAPYNAYARYFNAHRIDTPSSESGASHPENAVERDTAFGAYYNCGEIQRLICAEDSRVSAVVDTLAEANQSDIVLLIVNDEVYGGSGGWFAVASTNSSSAELILHETGHSFGSLTDEYDSALPNTPSDCGTTTATTEPNVSGLANFADIKWGHWLDNPDIEIPTPYTVDVSDPGFYAGSKYCQDLYRPTPNSKMRSLGRPFDAINEEALVLRIYDSVSAIDGFSPGTSSVIIGENENRVFEIDPLTPEFHQLNVQWLVNGVELASGNSLSSNLLPTGNQTITAVVTDGTEKVRVDTANKLVFEQVWQVSNSVDLAQSAYYENNVIYLPYVRITDDSSLYSVELTITSTTPYQFTVIGAEVLNSLLQPVDAASFSAGILSVNNLSVDGIGYQVLLQLESSEPEIVFGLFSATEN